MPVSVAAQIDEPILETSPIYSTTSKNTIRMQEAAECPFCSKTPDLGKRPKVGFTLLRWASYDAHQQLE